MPRIKIISKLPKAAGGLDVNSVLQPPVFNFTGGPQSVWNQPNYAGAQPQGQIQSPQQTPPAPPVQQQAASPQMFNPTGNVPQSSMSWNSQAPTFPVPKNDAIKIDQEYQSKGTPEHNYNTVALPTKKPSTFFDDLHKANNTIDQVATIGNMGLGYLDRQKKQKENNSWMAKVCSLKTIML